jgi:hypothetical protein
MAWFWDLIGTWAMHLLSAGAGGAAGVMFKQRIVDWFAGIEKDVRAKANEAAQVVLQAANTEVAKVKQSALDAAGKAVDGAKQAAGVPVTPAPEAVPAQVPAT